MVSIFWFVVYLTGILFVPAFALTLLVIGMEISNYFKYKALYWKRQP